MRPPLKLFIYNLSGLPTSCGVHERSNNYEHEIVAEAALRSVLAVVHKPQHANVFLLPACLSSLWSSFWSRTGADTSASNSDARYGLDARSVSALADFEARVLERIRSVGPFFERNGGADHIVMRMRCPLFNEPPSPILQTLWAHPRLKYLCIETPALVAGGGLTRAEASGTPSRNQTRDPTLDSNRSLYVPFYAGPMQPLPKSPVERVLHNLTFLGSLCCGRGWIARALPRSAIHLIGHMPSDGRGGQGSPHQGTSFDAKGAMSLLRQARYTLQPSGDLPGAARMSLYQSLCVAGTPVVLTDAVPPPMGLSAWPAVALLRYPHELIRGRPWAGRVFMDELLHEHTTIMKSFDEARGVLCWGTPAFKQQLQRLLTNVAADTPPTF